MKKQSSLIFIAFVFYIPTRSHRPRRISSDLVGFNLFRDLSHRRWISPHKLLIYARAHFPYSVALLVPRSFGARGSCNNIRSLNFHNLNFWINIFFPFLTSTYSLFTFTYYFRLQCFCNRLRSLRT